MPWRLLYTLWFGFTHRLCRYYLNEASRENMDFGTWGVVSGVVIARYWINKLSLRNPFIYSYHSGNRHPAPLCWLTNFQRKVDTSRQQCQDLFTYGIIFWSWFDLFYQIPFVILIHCPRCIHVFLLPLYNTVNLNCINLLFRIPTWSNVDNFKISGHLICY